DRDGRPQPSDPGARPPAERPALHVSAQLARVAGARAPLRPGRGRPSGLGDARGAGRLRRARPRGRDPPRAGPQPLSAASSASTTVVPASTLAAGSASSPARTRASTARFVSPPTRKATSGWAFRYGSEKLNRGTNGSNPGSGT